jgi:hypothetical protein
VDKAWGCAAGARSKEGNARERERGRTEEKGKRDFPRIYTQFQKTARAFL